MIHLASFSRLDMAPNPSLAVTQGSSLADTKKEIAENEQCDPQDVTVFYNSDSVSEEDFCRLRAKEAMDRTCFYHVKDKEASKALKDIESGNYDNDQHALIALINKYPYDADIALAVIKKDGTLLRFTSNYVKCDRQIVLEAVKQNGMALASANHKFLFDKEIVLIALRNNADVRPLVAHFFPDDSDIKSIVEKNSKEPFSLNDGSKKGPLSARLNSERYRQKSADQNKNKIGKKFVSL